MAAAIFSGLSKRMLDATLKALRGGELIIYPTDTIYGIGCDMRNGKALDKLNQLKNRPGNKPFSFIVNDIADAAHFAKISNAAHRVMRRVLPGPYTFVLPSSSGVPRKMMSTEHTVGIRIPNHQIPLTIAKEFGGPIITTSVNLSSDQPINAIGDLSHAFLAAVAVVIDGGPVDNEPSTIIDFTKDDPVVLRKGKGFDELRPYIDFAHTGE